MPIIQGKILEGSTIHTDSWKAYDGLILNGYTHHRVYHHANEFSSGKSHVNGIESFSFGFYPGWQEIKFHYKKGFEPYKKGLSQITKET